MSIEGNGYTVTGIDAVWQKTAGWAEQVVKVHSASVAGLQVAADHFSLHLRMDISFNNGQRIVMDEIAVYQVDNEKSVSEQYFFRS